jgi:hypothetical protein
MAHLAGGFLREILSLKFDASAHDAGAGGYETDDRQACGRLATSRLANQTERVTLVQGEADAVDSLDDTCTPEREKMRL